MRRSLTILVATTAFLAASVTGVAPAEAIDSTPVGIVPMTPCVILDTSVALGPFEGPLQGSDSVDIQTTGALGGQQGGATNCQIPSGVSGILVNIVAHSPLREGNLRAFPTGESSTGGVVNFSVQTPAVRNSNAVIVPVSPAGQLTIFANGGPSGVGLNVTDVVVTAIGYLSTSGLNYTPLTPCAFADSRANQGSTGGHSGTYAGNETRTMQVASAFLADQGGGNTNCAIPDNAEAVLVNLVAANSVGSGQIGVRSAGGSNTTTYVGYSQVTPPMNNSNAVIVPLSPGGGLDLFSVASAGNSTHIRAEAMGYLSTSGDEYVPISPCAIFDSRSNQGATGTFAGRYDGGESRSFQITGTFPSSQGGGNTNCGVPAGATGVMVNVEAVNPLRAGNFKAYATGTIPSGGIVNFAALSPSMNNANAAIVALSADGRLTIESNGGPAGLGLPTAESRGVVMGYIQPSGLINPPLGNASFDYQIGVAYPLPTGVSVVARDWFDSIPAAGAYNICYVNAFQTQPNDDTVDRPDELDNWPANLVLGEDPAWPGEHFIDIGTAANRTQAAQLVNAWVDTCNSKGYDAIEFDNLDTWTRVGDPLTAPFDINDTVAYATLITSHAHSLGLAVGQKNSSELFPAGHNVTIGFDFAVSEECGQFDECDAYTAAYGNKVIVIEYINAGFISACSEFASQLSIVRRDLFLDAPGSNDYDYESC